MFLNRFNTLTVTCKDRSLTSDWPGFQQCKAMSHSCNPTPTLMVRPTLVFSERHSQGPCPALRNCSDYQCRPKIQIGAEVFFESEMQSHHWYISWVVGDLRFSDCLRAACKVAARFSRQRHCFIWSATVLMFTFPASKKPVGSVLNAKSCPAGLFGKRR